MNYCKITTSGSAQMMSNPYRMTIANPDENKKALIAQIDGWLEMIYTDEPEYDLETQYLTEAWVEEGGKAVQVWTVHEKTAEDADEFYEN